MNLKQSIRLAIIFQIVSLVWSVALNVGIIEWDQTIGLILNLGVSGTMILFLINLNGSLKE